MINKLIFLILILLSNINNKNGVKYNIYSFSWLNYVSTRKNDSLFYGQFNQSLMPFYMKGFRHDEIDALKRMVIINIFNLFKNLSIYIIIVIIRFNTRVI